MEVSGTVLRQVTYVSGSGTHGHYGSVASRVLARSKVRMVRGCGFRDEGHVQYYRDTKIREPVLSNKKKLKLLKDLSKAKGVSSFPQLGFAFDPDQRALIESLNLSLTTDGGEGLLREIEKARAEEKEMKKRRKQEKKALKASKMKNVPDCESSSSSSSSESSDSDCEKVVDMNTFRGAGVGVAVTTKPVDELKLQQPPCLQSTLLSTHPLLPDTITPQHVSSVVNNPTAAGKTIEVCMGNKCKKSGAVALLQEFEKVVGVEGGAVVGCKCMGKCKTAPNVRIQNHVLDHGLSLGIDDSLKKIPSNPLCIGVGLEDVDTIVARFLGENNQDMMMGVAAATT